MKDSKKDSVLVKIFIVFSTVLNLLFPSDQVLAEIFKVGKGSYTDALKGEDQTLDSIPKVSSQFKGKISTNDWMTSLPYNTVENSNPFSFTMFPHPLSTKATVSGLQIGYPSRALVSEKNYSFRGEKDLILGLNDCLSEKTLLDDHSDWVTTALWSNPSEGCAYRVTFGHGLPFIYLNTSSPKQEVKVQFLKDSISAIGTPLDPITYTVSGLNGTYDGNSKLSAFEIYLDAGKVAGVSGQVRISYDFNDDKVFDKVETWGYLALDPVANKFEVYSTVNKTLDAKNSRGSYADFKNGRVVVEIWRPFGKGPLYHLSSSSFFKLPYSQIPSLYFKPGATPSKASELITTKVGSQSIDVIGETIGNSDGSGVAKVWAERGNVFGITVNGHHYGIFAPTGTTLQKVGGKAGELWIDGLKVDLQGKGYLSVAVLPKNDLTVLQEFQSVAYNFVTEGTFNYSYNTTRGEVISEFKATITSKESNGTNEGPNEDRGTILALYPHQWENIKEGTAFSSFEYVSSRGLMKTVKSTSFTTVMKFHGILPSLPDVGGYDRNQLIKYINDEYLKLKSRTDAGKRAFDNWDSYWNGKELTRTTDLAQIANLLGLIEIRNYLIKIVEAELEDWFTADDTGKRYLFLNKKWNVLIGFPASYGSSTSFNDLHFHFGYFIRAAAIVAIYDPQWAREENWGGMVNLLARNVASPDKADPLFPFLRTFDPYAGHSWAGGTQASDGGNNQESSSESMQLATGLIIWGEATGHKKFVDTGVVLHMTESEAIKRYWFDLKNTIFPENFPQLQIGILWGNGAAYGTYWTADPDQIHGINYLPMNTGLFYLGQDPDYILRNFASMNANLNAMGIKPVQCPSLSCYAWPGLQLEWLSLSDPEQAINLYNENPLYKKAGGETKAHTYHWIFSMNELGHVEPTIQANTPLFSVFNKEGLYTYVAYNSTSQNKVVTFSNGFSFNVPAFQFAVSSENPEDNGKSIPISEGINLIQAEDFVNYYDQDEVNTGGEYRSTGVDIAANRDQRPGYHVTSIVTGEWLEYNISVQNLVNSDNSNNFTLALRAAADASAGQQNVEVMLDGQSLGMATLKIGSGRLNFSEMVLPISFPLSKGFHKIRVNFHQSGLNLNHLVLRSSRYQGISDQLKIVSSDLATIVQAEDFYESYDSDRPNQGNTYRDSIVDIQPTKDTGGGFNIGWTQNGEWVSYPIEIKKSGYYQITTRVASGRASTVGNKTLSLLIGDMNLKTISFSESPGWQTFLNKDMGIIYLQQGLRMMKIQFQTDAINLNYIVIQPVSE